MNHSLEPYNVAHPSDPHAEFDRLMYVVSHDVAASVRALTVIPEWIVEDLEASGMEAGDAFEEHVEMLTRHAKRLDLMMQDLLRYSRVGRLQKIEVLDISSVVTDVVNRLGAGTDWSITHHVDTCLVKIGRNDIVSLIEELVGNAIKHSDQSHGVLEITSEIKDGVVILRFSDNGPGIEPKFQQCIFDVMRKLQSRDQVEGSGMGLAIAKKICDFYQGHIWVESLPPERGTVFGVSLPLHAED